MNIFEVISTNLDEQDGYFVNILFTDIEKAKQYCREQVKQSERTNVLEDFNGLLTEFQGESLENTRCKKKPAIYGNSFYGNFKMVTFIETRTTQ